MFGPKNKVSLSKVSGGARPEVVDDEDEVRRAERELDDLTHTYVAQVDELLKHKEAELLEV